MCFSIYFTYATMVAVFKPTSGKASVYVCLNTACSHWSTIYACLQGYDKDLVEVTVSALSGAPVPPLGVLGAPRPEDVEMIEKQRQRLQKRRSLGQGCWGLLRCTGTETEVNSNIRQHVNEWIYKTYMYILWSNICILWTFWCFNVLTWIDE